MFSIPRVKKKKRFRNTFIVHMHYASIVNRTFIFDLMYFIII